MNIWSEDLNGYNVASTYGFKHVRSSVGPNWQTVTKGCVKGSPSRACPPIGQSQAAYDLYVAENFDAGCTGGAKCYTDGLAYISKLR